MVELGHVWGIPKTVRFSVSSPEMARKWVEMARNGLYDEGLHVDQFEHGESEYDVGLSIFSMFMPFPAVFSEKCLQMA